MIADITIKEILDAFKLGKISEKEVKLELSRFKKNDLVIGIYDFLFTDSSNTKVYKSVIEKYGEPKVGQKLYKEKYGLITVVERGVFERGEVGMGGSKYSVCTDIRGNIILHQNKIAWFYDDFLTDDCFEGVERYCKHKKTKIESK
jgi:hypothetical protein